MTEQQKSTEAPPGLAERGQRMWASLLAQDVSLEYVHNPARDVAYEACRVADLLERFAVECEGAPLTIEGRSGPINNPILAERRQQQQNLKQLVAALRLPDEATGKRPQRRTARGAQRPSGKAAVSSLDRARQAKTG